MKMTMSEAEIFVLLALLEQTELLRTEIRNATWLNPWLKEQKKWGPLYNTTKWFGPVSEARKRQLLRAVDRLHEKGLVIASCEWGIRLSHMKLTRAGKPVAKELAAKNRRELNR
jgi:hypothetical protein